MRIQIFYDHMPHYQCAFFWKIVTEIWPCYLIGLTSTASSSSRSVTPPAGDLQYRHLCCLSTMSFNHVLWNWTVRTVTENKHNTDHRLYWFPSASCLIKAIRLIITNIGYKDPSAVIDKLHLEIDSSLTCYYLTFIYLRYFCDIEVTLKLSVLEKCWLFK